MIIKAKTWSIANYQQPTQATLASSLRTTSSGTPWYDYSYPMADTLNSYLSAGYVPYGTNVTAATYKNNVVSRIDKDTGVAGDAWQVSGGPHLVGHPVGSEIYHWFAIYAYTNNGDTNSYADPVH